MPLIDIGFFKDQKMELLDGKISQLTFSEYVSMRIVCMDETDHLFKLKYIEVIAILLLKDLTKMAEKEEGTQEVIDTLRVCVLLVLVVKFFHHLCLLRILATIKYNQDGVKI